MFSFKLPKLTESWTITLFSILNVPFSPVPDTIIYEQPLNERMRIFLRLEFLFKRVDIALLDGVELKNQDAINGILTIMSVFKRAELKSELIKELERLTVNLMALENTPDVDKQTFDELLAELDQTVDALQNKSPIGQHLQENDFLSRIHQRSNIPGGSCDFDIPAYHFWLQHASIASQKQQLHQWFEQLSVAHTAIGIIFRVIRSGTDFSQRHADVGFYQQSLNSSKPSQIIRVKLSKSAQYYPEISGGKHRFTVRFMSFNINQRPQQISDDIPFALSCCCAM